VSPPASKTKAGPPARPKGRSPALLASTGLLLLVWGFVLGVLVGRGDIPLIIPQNSPPVIETVQTAPKQAPSAKKKPPDLDFYDELSRQTEAPAPPSSLARTEAIKTPRPAPQNTVEEVIPPPATTKPVQPRKETASLKEARFTIQIAAFKDEAEAEFFATQVSGRTGLDFQVVAADLGSRGVWHRVRLGAFATRTQALKQARKLEASGLAGPLVVPFEPEG